MQPQFNQADLFRAIDLIESLGLRTRQGLLGLIDERRRELAVLKRIAAVCSEPDQTSENHTQTDAAPPTLDSGPSEKQRTRMLEELMPLIRYRASQLAFKSGFSAGDLAQAAAFEVWRSLPR